MLSQFLLHYVSVVVFWTLANSKINNLELISILPYNIPTAGALSFTGAALELAAEAVNGNQQFSQGFNISLKFLYNKQDRTCQTADSNAPLLLAEYYNNNGYNRCVAVISSACSGMSSVPYLTKEWNVLLLVKIINQVNAPTSVGIAGSIEGFAMAVMELCRKFRWFHVTVFMDSLRPMADIDRSIFDATKSLAIFERYSKFQIDAVSFSSSDKQSMRDALKFANERSRVFHVMAHTSVTIELMRMMKKNTDVIFGNYVFVVMQPTQQSLFGAASLFDYPNNEETDLFNSVLYLSTFAPVGNGSEELNQLLIGREKAAYGTVFESGQKPLDLPTIRGAHQSVQLIATLINEYNKLTDQSSAAASGSTSTCGGRELTSLLSNQTYSFSSGSVKVNANGTYYVDLVLYTFNQEKRTMQITAYYEGSSQTFKWEDSITMEGLVFNFIRDVPECGFSGMEGPCKLKSVKWITSYLLPVIITVVILAVPIAAAASYSKYVKIHDDAKTRWWLLSYSDLRCSSYDASCHATTAGETSLYRIR